MKLQPYDATWLPPRSVERVATSVSNAAELLELTPGMVRLPVYMPNGERVFAQMLPSSTREHDGARSFVMELVARDAFGDVWLGLQTKGSLRPQGLESEIRRCMRTLKVRLTLPSKRRSRRSGRKPRAMR